jgi:NAD(P)H dehydrogenase (quinone)
MSIAITAATGQLGRLVVADLLAAGVPAGEIKVVVRDEQKAADLVAQGVRLHVADYDDPASFAGAFRAEDRVLLISGSEPGKREPQHKAVIDAASAAGVAQLAYTGIFGGPDADFRLAAEHRSTEQLILDAGLPYTFLRNNWYTEMSTDQLPGILERGAVINSVDSNGRLATAARADYAAAAAVVLRSDGHLNKAYELSGDHAWSWDEFAAETSKQSGKQIVHTTVDSADQLAALLAAGLPESFAEILVDVDDAINRGRLAGTPGDLAKLIGRPTTPLADSIAAAIAGLGAGAPA